VYHEGSSSEPIGRSFAGTQLLVLVVVGLAYLLFASRIVLTRRGRGDFATAARKCTCRCPTSRQWMSNKALVVRTSYNGFTGANRLGPGSLAQFLGRYGGIGAMAEAIQVAQPNTLRMTNHWVSPGGAVAPILLGPGVLPRGGAQMGEPRGCARLQRLREFGDTLVPRRGGRPRMWRNSVQHVSPEAQ